MKASLFRPAQLIFVLSLSACYASLAVDAGPTVLDESEPNDQAADATWFGTLAPGTGLVIGGHVTDLGPDFYDGFAFTTSAPCAVRIRLNAFTPGADLDVCVYDPLLDDFIACFDGPFDPEIGEISFFAPGQEFHLVVSSAFGSSSYTLEVDTFPLYAAMQASPAPRAPTKQTPERLSPYRRAAGTIGAASLESLLGAGVVGTIDLVSGEQVSRPFRIDRRGLTVGPARVR